MRMKTICTKDYTTRLLNHWLQLFVVSLSWLSLHVIDLKFDA
jgi:hypothetical protein